MKNKIIIAVLLMISGIVNAQLSPNIKKFKNDTIVWHPDSLLQISDFKGKPKGTAQGATYAGLFLYQKEVDGNLNFFVEAVFLKSKSFVKSNSEYVLKHEQLHFDIAELYARKLRQKISLMNFKKVNNLVPTIDGMYKKYSQDMFNEEDKYDNQTEHGLNAAKQKMWADNVQKELKDLEAYSSTQINTVK